MDDFTAADEATQQRRIESMRGKNVLFITCFLASYLYDRDLPNLKRIASWGAKLHMAFGESDEDKTAKKRFEADGLLTGEAIFADISNDQLAGENIAAAARASGIKFDAVFSPYEHAMFLVGEVGEKLGLPCNSSVSYSYARDKRLAREVCHAKNVPAPLFKQITKLEDIEPTCKEFGFPIIVKPSSGASSEGVYKCNSVEEVCDKFEKLMEDLKVGQFFKWNPGCAPCVLLEEYIDGDEFDVDVLLWEGKCVYTNVIDNWPCIGLGFLETGSNCPSVSPDRHVQQLKDYAVACVKALDFHSGLFHVECKYSMKRKTVEDGLDIGQPMLIEVNPRMGGGRTHMWHKQVWGVDLFDNFFLASCNVPINPPRAPAPLCFLADYDLAAPKTGILTNSTWMDGVQGHPNVVWAEAYEMAGQAVKGVNDYIVPDWIGLLIVKADSSVNAVAMAKKIADELDYPIVDPVRARASLTPDSPKMLSRQQVARRASLNASGERPDHL